MKKPVVLVIMDGYGIAPDTEENAVTTAETPVLDRLFRTYPHTLLSASGSDVGLPPGQIGNSEVGHTNIGAGRVVHQELSKINEKIRTGEFYENPVFNGIIDACKKNGTALHLMGLVSPGGVHSHTAHLYALLELAKRRGLTCVYIHCFTDGRDVLPATAKEILGELQEKCEKYGTGKIATIMGRIYAMDRDERWDRVEKAYNCMTCGEGEYIEDAVEAVARSYGIGVTDEFIAPVVCDKDGLIKKNDSVIFFNFRPDRAREITRAFTEKGFNNFIRQDGVLPLQFASMTQYDEMMKDVPAAYPPEDLRDTLGEVISKHGLTQLRTSETTKYAHVTYFLSGGAETPFPGEDRILVPTPAEYPTFDLIPEMSAYKVAETADIQIRSGAYDFIAINFANCDMVGHTGVFEAAVKAVEAVDACVGKVVEAVRAVGGVTLVTADHGNAECMRINDEPMTAHTTNKVPFILVSDSEAVLKSGKLSDIAPTVLEIMGIEKPSAMTGESLIIK